VHLETDDFYRFLAHRIDPSKPESHTLNTSIVKAFTLNLTQYWKEQIVEHLHSSLGNPQYVEDSLVKLMYAQFESLSCYDRHIIGTEGKSASSIIAEYLDRISKRDFALLP
jgi:hypothetical protein